MSDFLKLKHVKYKSFDEIKPYTKTSVIVTNIIVDIEKLIYELPIVPYTVLPKKRGRKRKEFVPPSINQNIPSGSIISLSYYDIQRGIIKPNKSGAYFRNSMSVIMIINDKKINFKLSRNGRIQMTGCKHDDDIIQCIKFMWGYIKPHKSFYKLMNWSMYKNIHSGNIESLIKDHDKNPPFYYDDTLKTKIIPVMRNIDFSLNFNVDREQLDKYFNQTSEFRSLLEASVAYTGVNIKTLVTSDIRTLPILKLEEGYDNEKWKLTNDTYDNYLSILNDKECRKNLYKERYNTFLVFHSGKVILSSIHSNFSRDSYHNFLKTIDDNYFQIKETLSI